MNIGKGKVKKKVFRLVYYISNISEFISCLQTGVAVLFINVYVLC